MTSALTDLETGFSQIMVYGRRLHNAARRGNLDEVKRLLTDENINSRCPWGFTPLNVACYGGHVEVVKFLLESGADIQLDDGEDWTPLHAACMEGHTSCVKLLLSYGAAKCVNMSSGNRRLTPLIVACKSKFDGLGQIVELLIGAGADVSARSAQNRTPLMDASARGFHKKIELLLKAGADVHAVDESGLSALHMAVPFPKIVKLLIDSGADVNLVDNRGEIPLQRKNLSLEAIPMLLEQGAGADMPCLRHKKCNGSSIVSCLHKTSRMSAKKGSGCGKLNVMEKYFIKLEVAGLCGGQGSVLLDPPLELSYWNTVSRDEFRAECASEVAMMKTSKIADTNATYLDALLQRPYALKHVKPHLLERCQVKFSIYGELIWIRFLSGCRRRPLIGESIDFFSVAEDIPYLPPECVAEILSYLSERDLKVVLAIYKSAKRRTSTQPESNKRGNPDSPRRVMKLLKVD